MPPSNWCKLHSQAVHSDVFQDADLWRFWCYILMRTSRNGNVVIMHGQQLKLNPGQCVIGRKQAARDCYTTEQRVRTMINHLKSMENITTESTNRCTVVTVCNWEGYQSGQPIKQPAEQPANQPTANQQTTNRQPAANHNLEVQREKKEKKKRDTPHPPKGGKRKRFTKPTIDEVRAYISERGYAVNANKWMDHYEANGWRVGRNPMKDWKAAVRTWTGNGCTNAANNITRRI